MKTIAPKIGVCIGVMVLALLADYSMCYGQRPQMDDVVYLKNGSIIRGIIIEQIPGASLKIETKDGNVFFYTLDEVEKFTKEPSRQVMSNSPTAGRKSGGTAFILSLLIPGGGQFYNGEGGKGAAMLGMSVLGVILIASSGPDYNYDDGYYSRNDGDGGSIRGHIWRTISGGRHALVFN